MKRIAKGRFREEGIFIRNGKNYWVVKTWKYVFGGNIRYSMRLYVDGQLMPIKRWRWTIDQEGNVVTYETRGN